MNEPSIKGWIDPRSREESLPDFRQLPNYRQWRQWSEGVNSPRYTFPFPFGKGSGVRSHASSSPSVTHRSGVRSHASSSPSVVGTTIKICPAASRCQCPELEADRKSDCALAGPISAYCHPEQLLRSLARSVTGEGKRRGGCVFLQPPCRAGEGAAWVGALCSIFLGEFLISGHWRCVPQIPLH